MKTRHLLAALAALLASAAPVLASNTGITIQIPAAVTSVAASDVTVLDTAGYFAGINVESVLAELQRDPFVIVANTAALPLDEAGKCDGFALALVSTETGGPLLYRCAVSPTWTPILVPVGPITSSQLTMATARLLGRTTASTGAIEEVSVSSPLTLAAGALGVGTVGVANGGTGAASLTAYAPVCGGTTTTAPVQSCGTGIGTVGYVWTSTGASSVPIWQAASGGGIGGSAGATDNVLLRSDGAGGATVQASSLEVSDANPVFLSFVGQAANGALLFSNDGTITSRGGLTFTTNGNARRFKVDPDNAVIKMGATSVLGAYSHADPEQGSLDVGLSRVAAGVYGIGTGAAGSVAGTLAVTSLRITPQATAPAACVAAQDLYSDTSGALCFCTATDTWTNVSGVGACA